jgi:putative transposase
MKASRFSEEQIIGMKEQEAGMSTADVCRKHSISSATFYKYKAKYGGMEVSEARRLKALDAEKARLKKLVAEAMLDAMLKDLSTKKSNARCQAKSRGLPLRELRAEPASGVFRDRGRSNIGALSKHATG